MKKFIRFIEFKNESLIIWKTYRWNPKYIKDLKLELTIVNKETDEIYFCYYNPIYVRE